MNIFSPSWLTACFEICLLCFLVHCNKQTHSHTALVFIPLSPSDCDTYCKASKGKLKINMKKYCKKDYGKQTKTINPMYFNFFSREPNTRLKQGQLQSDNGRVELPVIYAHRKTESGRLPLRTGRVFFRFHTLSHELITYSAAQTSSQPSNRLEAAASASSRGILTDGLLQLPNDQTGDGRSSERKQTERTRERVLAQMARN